MRNSTVKKIRRALKAEIAEGTTESWVAHPFLYKNVQGTTMLRYKFQYFIQGGKKYVQLAKRLYRATGLLPLQGGIKNATK